ncbi:iron-containing alcohol dehydrogenase, partial [Porticoccaceae bacterium]|nr:iron-containing alcohol dehydrogenase [Porticoccaceae bacterium]
PAVMRFNSSAVADHYAALATAAVPGFTGGDTAAASAELFICALEQLMRDLKMPMRLREMNINEGDLPVLAKDALLQQRLLVNNPRAVSYEDALAIYRAAY